MICQTNTRQNGYEHFALYFRINKSGLDALKFSHIFSSSSDMLFASGTEFCPLQQAALFPCVISFHLPLEKKGQAKHWGGIFSL